MPDQRGGIMTMGVEPAGSLHRRTMQMGEKEPRPRFAAHHEWIMSQS